MIKRLLLGFTLFLLLSVAAWYWQVGSSNCDSCLPMPDLTSFLHPVTQLELPYPAPPAPDAWDTWTAAQRLADVTQRVQPRLNEELNKRSIPPGAPVYLRAFKEERLLELWLRSSEGWKLWRSYPIAAASGRLGPKQREGDYQVPEGFYAVTTRQMNPASKYHLAFNIGYPNAHDQHHQRTGSFIMIHGRAVSIGCLAMTDPAIEEIYLLIQAALEKGQPTVPVHLFPFRFTEQRLQASADDPWAPFWRQELLPAWQHFEATHQVPKVSFVDGFYRLRD